MIVYLDILVNLKIRVKKEKNKMNIKTQEIFALYELLNGNAEINQNKMAVSTAYKLIRNKKKLETEYYNIIEMRDSIVRSYGEPDEEGKVTIPKDKIEEANKKLYDLQMIEYDIDLQPINLSELENLEVSLSTIEILDPIIEED